MKSKRMDPSIKHQTMKPFNITTNGIIKLLNNLNHHKRGHSYVVLTFVFYVCLELFHSRVWFFLLWCYDVFDIFPVWLSCDLLSMMFKLSPRILKELADEISPFLQLIYTQSLDTGEVPADWRTANVWAVSHRNGLFENHVVVDIKCCFLLHVAWCFLQWYTPGSYSKQMWDTAHWICRGYLKKPSRRPSNRHTCTYNGFCQGLWHSKPQSTNTQTKILWNWCENNKMDPKLVRW
jgi:hypothetical protein